MSERPGRPFLGGWGRCIVPPLAGGLYLARCWCESRPQGLRGVELFLAVAAGLGLAAAGVALLRRLRAQSWPLVLLVVYLLWPQADGRLRLGAGVVALGAFLLAQRRPAALRAWMLDLALAGAALGLYLATLAPTVQPADAGEFQLVSYVLGIAHPPGYPLYTLLGKAFTLLPAGDAAWRVNLFAAVCAAATLAVVSRAVRQATGSAAAGVLAALALGLVPTFWSQATLANVRSLTGLLVALAIYFLLRCGQTRSSSDLLAFAVSFGLGAGHHSSMVLLALPFAAYLVAVDRRLLVQPRRWLGPAAGLGASLLVLLYLPLRSAMRPAFDPEPIRTLDGFLGHVLALGFRGDFLYFLRQPTLGARFGVLADILRIEFGWGLGLLALALGVAAARRRAAWLVLWGGVATVNSLAAVTYRAPQTVEYLLPTYVALAVGLGLGLGSLSPSPSEGEGRGEGERRQGGESPSGEGVGCAGHSPLTPPSPLQGRGGRPLSLPSPLQGRGVAGALVGGLVAWLALANGLAALPSYRALHRDDSARRQALELLLAAPPGATILSNWHQATPLWYLQQVEGVRRDVTVTYVYPEGATPNGVVWARRLGEAAARGPVLVTNRFPELDAGPHRLLPVGEAWGVGCPPQTEGFAGEPRQLGGRIEFLGARVDGADLSPGQTITVQVAWRALSALDRDYSWFVHLVGPQGIAGQADLTHQADRVAPGERMLDRYRFALRPNALPGEYRLIAGVYVTYADGRWQRLHTPAGEEAPELAQLFVGPRPEAPATAHPLAVAWADGSRLVGVDADDSLPGQRRLYLHWYRPPGAREVDLTLTSGDQTAAPVRLPGGDRAGYQTVACDLPAGARELRLSAASGGRVLAWLGAWHAARPGPLALPDLPAGARYLDFGGEIVLVGADLRPGDPWQADLRFLAARPLLRDYSVSLSLDGEGWRAQHDGTPALGAIPTLKWLGGWQVRDPRRLDLPAVASGSARLRLTVYDAFTLAPLPVGDDRLAQAGQGVQAVLWQGDVRDVRHGEGGAGKPRPYARWRTRTWMAPAWSPAPSSVPSGLEAAQVTSAVAWSRRCSAPLATSQMRTTRGPGQGSPWLLTPATRRPLGCRARSTTLLPWVERVRGPWSPGSAQR